MPGHAVGALDGRRAFTPPVLRGGGVGGVGAAQPRARGQAGEEEERHPFLSTRSLQFRQDGVLESSEAWTASCHACLAFIAALL